MRRFIYGFTGRKVRADIFAVVVKGYGCGGLFVLSHHSSLQTAAVGEQDAWTDNLRMGIHRYMCTRLYRKTIRFMRGIITKDFVRKFKIENEDLLIMISGG